MGLRSLRLLGALLLFLLAATAEDALRDLPNGASDDVVSEQAADYSLASNVPTDEAAALQSPGEVISESTEQLAPTSAAETTTTEPVPTLPVQSSSQASTLSTTSLAPNSKGLRSAQPSTRFRGIFGSLKKLGGKLLGAAKSAVGAVGGALKRAFGGASGNKGPKGPDIEDCVACRFVWLQVEQQVGNSVVEEQIYDAFTRNCIEAQKAPIFFPACEDMFDDIYGMIGDYIDGFTVNQICEGARMCR